MVATTEIFYNYGGTNSFAINFTSGFIDRSHVKCTVNGDAKNIIWVNDGVVSVDAIMNVGDLIRFYRDTPKDTAIHNFVDGQALTEDSLDTNFKQGILINQENTQDFSTFVRVQGYTGINTLVTPIPNNVLAWSVDGKSLVSVPATTLLSSVDTLPNVQALRLYAGNEDGLTVYVLGHTTVGKGGGFFRFDASASSPIDDDGLTIVTATGKCFRRLITNGFIDSDMFNGDVTKLFPSARSDYVLKLMQDVSVSSVLVLNRSSVTIDFNGFGMIPAEDGVSILQMWGSGVTTSYTNLSSNFVFGSNTFVAPIDLAVGDYVQITTNEAFPAPNAQNGKIEQIFRITKKINSTTYQTDFTAQYNFTTTQTARVAKCGMLQDVTLIRPRINRLAYTNTFGIGLNLRYIHKLTIESPTFLGSKQKYATDIEGRSALKIGHCLDVTVNDLRAYHLGWYGLEIFGNCRNVRVYKGYGHDCRHAVSYNWLENSGEPIDCSIYDFVADYCTLSGLDTHDRGKNICWYNCTSRNSRADSGFQQRANDVKYFNCVAHGNYLDGFIGRGITIPARLKNCESYSNLRNGFTFTGHGLFATDCETYSNASAGYNVSSGKIIGGLSNLNLYSIRIPFSTDDPRDLVCTDCNLQISSGTNYVLWDDATNYNLERTVFNSCFFYNAVNTPWIANPSGNKTGQSPRTNGHNKLTLLTNTKNRAKNFVTLSGGTARVNVPVHRFITTSGLGINVVEKIRLTPVTAVNAGVLRYVLDTAELYFDIFSTNSSDASVVEWEILGV